MAIDLVAGAVILGLILYRQLRARTLQSEPLRLPLVLAVIGVVTLGSYLKSVHVGPAVIASLLGSLALAGAFGLARGATVRVWLQGGQAWRRGTWLTAALWVASLASHLGYDALLEGGSHRGHGGLGSASLLLYLAVTYGVQRLVAQRRAAGLSPVTGADMDGFAVHRTSL